MARALRLLAALLAAFHVSAACAADDVVFVNGIKNTLAQAKEGMLKLEASLNASSIRSGASRRTFTVGLVWNPIGWYGGEGVFDGMLEAATTGGLLGGWHDLQELFLLKTGEEWYAPVFPSLLLPHDRVGGTISVSAAASVKVYLDHITPGGNSLEDSGKITDADMWVTQKAVYKLTEVVRNSGRAIVVAHSQGNLLANLAWANYASEIGSEIRKRMRVVNVANTSRFSVNNLNLTHEQDAALFSAATDPGDSDVSLEFMPGAAPGALRWSRTTPDCPGQVCRFSVASPTFGGVDSTPGTLNHAFAETYLSSIALPRILDAQGVDFSSTYIAFKDRLEDLVYAAAASLDANQDDAGYALVNLSGASADPALTLFAGPKGGLGGVHMAPNDAGIAYGMENYYQNGETRFGWFMLDRLGGQWHLVSSASREFTFSSLRTNDSGQAIVRNSNLQGTQTVSVYDLVSRAQDGSVDRRTLDVPSGVELLGVLNDGTLLGVQGTTTRVYDRSMRVLRTIDEPLSGFGLDGLLFGMEMDGNKFVRFANGTRMVLPCNAVPGQIEITRPASGRNCSAILAASGSGFVAGTFHDSSGRQGVYRYSQQGGFEAFPIDPSYFGYVGNVVGSVAPPNPVGIANNGDILLAPVYSDRNMQICAGGPFLVSGGRIVDLKSYIPSGNCFNIQAGISGGGRVFMSSQAQSYAFFLRRN